MPESDCVSAAPSDAAIALLQETACSGLASMAARPTARAAVADLQHRTPLGEPRALLVVLGAAAVAGRPGRQGMVSIPRAQAVHEAEADAICHKLDVFPVLCACRGNIISIILAKARAASSCSIPNIAPVSMCAPASVRAKRPKQKPEQLQNGKAENCRRRAGSLPHRLPRSSMPWVSVSPSVPGRATTPLSTCTAVGSTASASRWAGCPRRGTAGQPCRRQCSSKQG